MWLGILDLTSIKISYTWDLVAQYILLQIIAIKRIEIIN